MTEVPDLRTSRFTVKPHLLDRLLLGIATARERGPHLLDGLLLGIATARERRLLPTKVERRWTHFGYRDRAILEVRTSVANGLGALDGSECWLGHPERMGGSGGRLQDLGQQLLRVCFLAALILDSLTPT